MQHGRVVAIDLGKWPVSLHRIPTVHVSNILTLLTTLGIAKVNRGISQLADDEK